MCSTMCSICNFSRTNSVSNYKTHEDDEEEEEEVLRSQGGW